MSLTPRRDPFIVIAIRDGAADHQQQHLRKRVSHPPRLTRVFNHREMVEQCTQTRLCSRKHQVKHHGGGSESAPHYRIRLPASRKPPLTRVRCPGVPWSVLGRLSFGYHQSPPPLAALVSPSSTALARSSERSSAASTRRLTKSKA